MFPPGGICWAGRFCERPKETADVLLRLGKLIRLFSRFLEHLTIEILVWKVWRYWTSLDPLYCRKRRRRSLEEGDWAGIRWRRWRRRWSDNNPRTLCWAELFLWKCISFCFMYFLLLNIFMIYVSVKATLRYRVYFTNYGPVGCWAKHTYYFLPSLYSMKKVFCSNWLPF